MGAVDLDIVGCVAIDRGSVACEVTRGGKLRLFANGMALTASTEQGPLSGPSERLGSRVSLEVTVPESATALDVAAEAADGVRTAKIALMAAAERPWLDEARGLRERGDTKRAEDLLRPQLASADATGAALATSLLARIELMRGNVAEALSLFRSGLERHRALGRISDAVDDALALSFALVQRSHGYAEARAVLDGIAPLAQRTAEGRARFPYYRGALEAEVGDRRAALAAFAESEQRAVAIGLVRLDRNARGARAVQLQLLGRTADARAILDELDKTASSTPSSRCERAEIANNIGYGALREAEVAVAAGRDGAAALDQARTSLARAVELAESRCPDPHLRAVAFGNLAWTEYRSGRMREAREVLARARQAFATPRGTEALLWLELDALLALEDISSSEPDRLKKATELFEKQRRDAHALVLREAEWSALTGLGSVFARAKRPKEAARALEEAEAILDELALLVPLGTGRGNFLRDRGESGARLVALHLDQGDAGAALVAARKARGRVLAAVRAAMRTERLSPEAKRKWETAVGAYRAARDEAETSRAHDWTKSSETLADIERARREREAKVAAAVDEALAAIGTRRGRTLPPLAERATTVFVHTARDRSVLLVAEPPRPVVARALPVDAGPRALADALARELGRVLAPGRVLRVLAQPPGVDLGSLPAFGGALGEHVIIEQSLDLEAPAAPSAEAMRVAFVVADPAGDLPAARAEGDDVIAKLKAAGLSDTSLVVGDEATTSRVRAGLERAQFFHYAGHAVSAGHEGWDSHLRLASGARLELADVLTLPRVPARVVLSSCEAAGALEAETATSFGLAQAFVVAGSDAVIAPVRPVKDASVAVLAAAAAAELAKAGAAPSGALLAALRATGTRVPPEDRWAFRLVRP